MIVRTKYLLNTHMNLLIQAKQMGHNGNNEKDVFAAVVYTYPTQIFSTGHFSVLGGMVILTAIRKYLELVKCKESEYAKGKLVCIQGHPAQKLFLITRGFVQTSKIFTDGLETGMHVLRKDSLLGITSLFIGKNTYHFTGITLTPCKAIEIDKEVFEQYLLENPSELAEILGYVNSLMEGFISFYTRTKSQTSSQKVLTFLCMLAIVGGELNEFGFEIAFPVSQKALASFLGLSEMSIRRCLAELASMNHILRSGKRIVVNSSCVAKLRKDF